MLIGKQKASKRTGEAAKFITISQRQILGKRCSQGIRPGHPLKSSTCPMVHHGSGRYAYRAKSIKNKPRINEDPKVPKNSWVEHI